MNQPFDHPAFKFEKYNSENSIDQTDFFSTGNKISQTFTAERDDLNRIGIKFVTQDRKIMLYFEYYSVNVIIFNYIVWIIVFLLSIFFIIKGLDIANEKTFLKLALCFTILYIIIVPFPHYLDEGAHFFRSYMISKGNIYNKIDENGQIGGYVSKYYGNYVFQGISLLKIANNSFGRGNLFDNNGEYFDTMKYFSSTVPTGHIIPAFGLFLGKILCLNSGLAIYLARLFTYLFYIICSYFAIKNLKYYKSVLFIIATLPIAMYVGGSISLDPIINGCAFLFVSICLKYYFDLDINSYISRKDIALLIFTAIFIITNKYLTYTPLILLFFLIPKKKFRTKKSYILMIISSIIIGIICILWQFYMLKTFPYVEDRTQDVNQIEQLKFSLTHPIYEEKLTFIMFILNLDAMLAIIIEVFNGI